MPLYRQKSGFAYFCGFLRTFAGFLRTFAHTKKNIISPKNPPKWRGGGGGRTCRREGPKEMRHISSKLQLYAYSVKMSIAHHLQKS